MTNEQQEQLSKLENVLIDMQLNLTLWKASRIMEIDEGDKESADALNCIFGERYEREVELFEKVFNELHALLVSGGKVGF